MKVEQLFSPQLSMVSLSPDFTDTVTFLCLQSESYQEDIYPMTTGAQPALTAQEWLKGVNKGQHIESCPALRSPGLG